MSTAQRAVTDLKSAGLVRVIRRGFDNQNGRSCAPIYQIERLTQVTQSVPSDQLTQVTQSPPSERVISGGRMGHIEERTGPPGDLLDGSIDGSIDGGARARDTDTDQPAAGPTPTSPHPEPARSIPREPNCLASLARTADRHTTAGCWKRAKAISGQTSSAEPKQLCSGPRRSRTASSATTTVTATGCPAITLTGRRRRNGAWPRCGPRWRRARSHEPQSHHDLKPPHDESAPRRAGKAGRQRRSNRLGAR
ncbi:MAG: hypothetical protein JWQ86_4198 [Mycobacterium sp.]|nr:hypothetical protein [Mycobacterium sp.]